jgi:hypothetical protein
MKSLRLALISTPRTGNNWLLNLLSRVYGLPGFSPTSLPNVPWQDLPPECAIILHWRRTPELVKLLQIHRFQAITMARHPLDVLLSILHFTLREPTDGWLEGEGGNEQPILGLAPGSQGFLDYACGPRARALLGVTGDWWDAPDCLQVRYEDLVENPKLVMERLAEALGVPPRFSPEAAAASTTLPRLRAQFTDRQHHFWQGKPGLWKELLPHDHAQQIARTHEECFHHLGYVWDPDPGLTSEEAEAHWWTLLGTQGTVPVLQKTLTQVKRDLEITRARLASLEEMGPSTLKLAGEMKRWAVRWPWLAGMVKKVLQKH